MHIFGIASEVFYEEKSSCLLFSSKDNNTGNVGTWEPDLLRVHGLTDGQTWRS